MLKLRRFLTVFTLLTRLVIPVICVESRELLIVTVATNETDGFQRFMRSIQVYGLDVKVIGLGVSWEGGDVKNTAGGGHKINLLKKELSQYKNDESRVIMFTDSYDVIFTAGKEAILEKFDSLNARVVFGAEDFCWPDRNLATQYPRVTFGYKYLNSGGFIGYAPEMFKIVALQDIENNEDDQLYYTNIFINKNLRDKFGIKLDIQAKIFQNLNGQFTDVILKFEEEDTIMLNTVYQSFPAVIHGNGPSKIILNSLGNYLAKSWSHDNGCLACEERKQDLTALS
ncbi:Procollagen-lysine,2-oxoglutarate 5-dioxygenase 1, partial [Halocaridina rubra]